MTADAAELAGILIACGAAAAAIAAPDRRVRVAAIFVALVAAPLLVLGDVWDEPRIVDLRDSPARLAAGLLLAAAIVAVLAQAFRRRPGWFAIAAIAVLPLRVPIEIGGDTANLLVPLYLVIAAGALAAACRGGPEAQSLPLPSPPALLRCVLAAGLVLYAIQSAYSGDVSNAIENIGFFLVPFAVLFVLLAEVEWTPRLLGRSLIGAVGVAVACAAIAIGQYWARELFLNDELFDANQLHAYFRVNSVFFDPNILGRYLALAMTAIGAYLAYGRIPNVPPISSASPPGMAGSGGGTSLQLAAASLSFSACLVALALSYSISGFAALLAGLGMVAILRWGWRGLAAAAAVGLIGIAALAIAGGTPTSDIEDTRSIDAGHEDLFSGGVELFKDRPLGGYGSGAFGRAFYEEIEPGARTTVSHSEPVTVAAEQGLPGLVTYGALLATALLTLFGRGVRSSLPRALVAACFAAMLISSFGYTGFTTDPATWALLALGIALYGTTPRTPGTNRATSSAGTTRATSSASPPGVRGET